MTKSRIVNCADRRNLKVGDILLSPDKDSIWMVVETINVCGGDPKSQSEPKAVCLWSDNEMNKDTRNEDESVSRIGEYREKLHISRRWEFFQGALHIHN